MYKEIRVLADFCYVPFLEAYPICYSRLVMKFSSAIVVHAFQQGAPETVLEIGIPTSAQLNSAVDIRRFPF